MACSKLICRYMSKIKAYSMPQRVCGYFSPSNSRWRAPQERSQCASYPFLQVPSPQWPSSLPSPSLLLRSSCSGLFADLRPSQALHRIPLPAAVFPGESVCSLTAFGFSLTSCLPARAGCDGQLLRFPSLPPCLGLCALLLIPLLHVSRILLFSIPLSPRNVRFMRVQIFF